MTEVAKEFCISVVHASCMKMESNASAILHYKTGVSGAKHFYLKSKEILHRSGSILTFPPPVELMLNKRNIADVQRAILDTFRYDDDNNVCGMMKNSPFWSLMHDGISKFHAEFNGVALRGLDDKNDPIVMLFNLRKMKVVSLVLTLHMLLSLILR